MKHSETFDECGSIGIYGNMRFAAEDKNMHKQQIAADYDRLAFMVRYLLSHNNLRLEDLKEASDIADDALNI